jgi:chromosome segregation ATPase
MTSNSDRFLKAVEDAEKIAQTLEQLQTEVSSYKSAGDSLDRVSENLEELFNDAKGTMGEISNLIKVLNEFGPTFLENQESLDKKLKALSGRINILGIEINDNQKQQTDYLKKIIFMTLILAALAFLVGVINIII